MQRYRVTGNAAVHVPEKAPIGVAEKISNLEWLQMQRYRVTGNAAVQVTEKAAVGVAEKSATQSGCRCSGIESQEMHQFKSLRKQRLECLKISAT
jgi:hypothetical protein